MSASLASLIKPVIPLHSDHSLDDIADRFYKDTATSDVLSLPVLDQQNQPIGLISRYQLNQIYLGRYSRELFGKKKLADFMQTHFVSVDVQTPLLTAASQVYESIESPLAVDFIITQKGQYLGVAAVIDLVKLMTTHLHQSNHGLNTAMTQLKQSQAQLVHSEKMASLGQLVAGFAHEMNTPLGYVSNNIDLTKSHLQKIRQWYADVEQYIADTASAYTPSTTIQQQLQENQVMFAQLDNILTDSEYGLKQMAGLVSSLKGFSRADASTTPELDLNTCIEQTLTVLNNTLKHDTRVETELTPLPYVKGSPQQINQVLMNLIHNAKAAITHQQGHICIKTWFDTHHVYASIQDNGCGIPTEVQSKIYDPFFTTKPVGEGTGLGLSICYQIIKEHQGRIKFVSKPNQGTRFAFALPRE